MGLDVVDEAVTAIGRRVVGDSRPTRAAEAEQDQPAPLGQSAQVAKVGRVLHVTPGRHTNESPTPSSWYASRVPSGAEKSATLSARPGRLAHGRPDHPGGLLGLGQRVRDGVAGGLGEHPFEASLEARRCEDAQQQAVLFAVVSQGVRGVSGREHRCQVHP